MHFQDTDVEGEVPSESDAETLDNAFDMPCDVASQSLLEERAQSPEEMEVVATEPTGSISSEDNDDSNTPSGKFLASN